MARDLFHNIVKDALIAEGWNVTHDPLPLDYGDVQMQIDLGADRLLAAEKEKQRIAIEVKSFLKPSAISEFHTAVGQYLNYRYALDIQEPNRKLYLAIPTQTYEEFFRLRFTSEVIKKQNIFLLSYQVPSGDLRWIN